ncbi:hypothetical protein [Microbacterium murale]|uniref:DUF4352 domain-containing protein n=1 Tax=Microbacterium murale TaxID=1081040 RepID=A0ABU0P5Z6_9MICO|nr:hypothetical protein [Microbacterium murale]MDQ0642756.1 hypothetical protein [Microbacterium murale]
MKRALPWLIGAALALAAGVITVNTPGDEVYRAPFLIRSAGDGDPATSRTLIASVLDASFSERVTVADAEWHADGNWLVVTVAASAPRTEVDARIQLATLVIGDRVFQSSERPGNSMTEADLRVGIDTVGTLAFELPPDVRNGRAEVRLTTSYSTPVLDDVVVLPISLEDLPTANDVDLEAPTLGES